MEQALYHTEPVGTATCAQTNLTVHRRPLLHSLFWVTRGDGLRPAGHTQRNQANTTAEGMRQSLTSEIRLTPQPQEVPSAWIKLCHCCAAAVITVAAADDEGSSLLLQRCAAH